MSKLYSANNWQTAGKLRFINLRCLKKFRVPGFAQRVHEAFDFLGVLLASNEQRVSGVNDDYVLESDEGDEPASVANEDAAGGIR